MISTVIWEDAGTVTCVRARTSQKILSTLTVAANQITAQTAYKFLSASISMSALSALIAMTASISSSVVDAETRLSLWTAGTV